MESFIKALLYTALIVILTLLYAFPLKILWNWLMPMIFGLKELTFGESAGLIMLCSILFKSYNTKSE